MHRGNERRAAPAVVAQPGRALGPQDGTWLAAVPGAAVAADYTASWASFYQDQIARPWPEVVEDVRRDVQAVIDHDGAFEVSGDLAAFVCR